MNPWWLRPTADDAVEPPQQGAKEPPARREPADEPTAVSEPSRAEPPQTEPPGVDPPKTEPAEGPAELSSPEAPEPAPAEPDPAPEAPAKEAAPAAPRSRRRRRSRSRAKRPPAEARAEAAPVAAEASPPPPAADRRQQRVAADLVQHEVAEGLAPLLAALPERQEAVGDERRIALFCDLENIALGVRDSDIQKFDILLVLERLLEKGKIIVKKAYADWQRYSEFKRTFHEAGIELIDIPQKSYSGKNSADIKMAVDAMELCYAKDHLDTFVVLSGDSDFSPLVSKLKENDKHVIGIGVKNSSSRILIDNCDEFIYYEDVWRDEQRPPRLDGLNKKQGEAFGLMVDAIEALMRENKDILWGSMIKQTMQRKRPSFNEGYYGYASFSELLEKAERQQLIRLKKDPRSGSYIVTGFAGR